ncbi:hypothetical protein BTM25_48080 [Actinomadura rubteroloni]|uniref:Glycosyl hydrolase family 32 C-terminal domain-containing protein n=1 Tax=Actinomadura rubteroloni TaxID=1926885 RepID=A0A2P4UF54_9ACTN|nr:GH32 C-terminal domain-containing protein [Actinomadura rubteroloni]POM23648.1 hypothetical protein BTM25_48080 [Actinomadura rubteroloni]
MTRSAPGAAADVRIIVDRSIAEIFLGTGEALTLRLYPVGDGPWRLRARAAGEGFAAFDVRVWPLRPAGTEDACGPS